MTDVPHRAGLALLEVMVALVILSIAAAGYLALFHGSHQLVGRSREWSAAVAYAGAAMEGAKHDLPRWERAAETLPGGFRREVTSRPWQAGLALVTVTVTLPTAGRFALRRVVEMSADAPGAPDAVQRGVTRGDGGR
jgi:prepilin-type N-terminal cleavage/methylation domain-containing protein